MYQNLIMLIRGCNYANSIELAEESRYQNLIMLIRGCNILKTYKDQQSVEVSEPDNANQRMQH